MADTLIRIKGVADIAVALILTFKPSVIYESVATRGLHSLSGLHMSNASIAPGFNQSIACMVAAVGVGHVAASTVGKSARPVIFAMNLTWALLGFLTCATPKHLGLGSATLLMSSCNHLAFATGLWWMDRGVVGIFFGPRSEDSKAKGE